MNEPFRKFAHRASLLVGSSYAFTFAVLLCVFWAALGPIFGFSNSWQLVINTGTTIITFLTVFLIQNMQNRETKTVQLKLDELLRAVADARTSLVNLEALSDSELDRLQQQFEELAQKAGTEKTRIRVARGDGAAAAAPPPPKASRQPRR